MFSRSTALPTPAVASHLPALKSTACEIIHAGEKRPGSLTCTPRRGRRVVLSSTNGSKSQANVSAHQSSEALPNTDAEGARQWISAWRFKAPSGAKLNGVSPNGSSSNQPGQAAAAKAPGEAPPKVQRPAKSKGFNNVNRFIVPENQAAEFEETWRERESVMQQLPGFLGFSLEGQPGSDYTTTSRWASIPEWEAYSLSEVSRRTHLPWGVYQHVPAKGEGFPEDFVPFTKMNQIVNAKY